MAHEWHAELVEALAAERLSLRKIENVSTIRFPGLQRATFRVSLESGETIKARRLEDEATAQRLVNHRRALPDTFVPAFARHGRVVLERWIDGQLLGNRTSTAVVAEAGALLAAVHATPSTDDRETREAEGRDWGADANGWLQALSAHGALNAEEVFRLSGELHRLAPTRTAVGVGHFDLCGENMMHDRAGVLRVFDNERVGIGPFGFDLARTWYRWDLPAADWQLFGRHYAASSPRHEPFSDAAFWRIVVLLQSARLRLSTTPTHLAVPLEKLRRLVEVSGEDDITP